MTIGTYILLTFFDLKTMCQRNLFENTWIECTMRIERKKMELKRAS